MNKVYKIWSESSPYFYIGSTTQSLKKRLWQHKRKARKKSISSYKIVKLPDCQITLLESYDGLTKQELENLEYQVIDELSQDGLLFNKCVNRKGRRK